MRKIIALASAAVMLGVTSLAAVAPALAAPWWWYNHPHYHHYWGGPGPALGAGLLGFAAGAAIAGAAQDRAYADSDDHVSACQDAYRSYDYRTVTYLGFDGMRHYCQL